MPFVCSLTVPKQEIFFLGQVIKQVRGGKEVHVQFMAKSCYRPGVAQRVGRSIALPFHDGTRRG